MTCGVAAADVDPLSGIDFVTITSPGNAAWGGNGTLGDSAVGRGSVGYEYRIGRMEVTSAQWAEFYSAAFNRPVNDRIPHVGLPEFWGASAAAGTVPGGVRFTTNAATANLPAGGVSWRTAAIYCNWLHNGKSTDRSAFLSGAYDVSTFSYFGNIFQDQAAHSPGARYYIPTWDEWLKAVHYDPNKTNADGSVGGWWSWANSSEQPPVYGPPGVSVNGQPTTSGGLWDEDSFPGYSPFAVPLGSYPQATSPWGLLDTSGGTSEWTESINTIGGGVRSRVLDGSAWVSSEPVSDRIFGRGGDFPNFRDFDYGFRIAAAVPGPTSGVCMVIGGVLLGPRRRR
jgi:formylglycine-generating enzyme required for sulfatase activity